MVLRKRQPTPLGLARSIDCLRSQGADARFCDGFRMAAPSLGSLHARWLPGRRSKAASEGNCGRVGTPISGRYGDFAGADGAAEVLEAGVGGKWFGRAGASEGMRGDFGNGGAIAWEMAREGGEEDVRRRRRPKAAVERRE